MHLNASGMSLVLALMHQRDVVDGTTMTAPPTRTSRNSEAWEREWDARQATWHEARRMAERWRVPAAKFRSNGDLHWRGPETTKTPP